MILTKSLVVRLTSRRTWVVIVLLFVIGSAVQPLYAQGSPVPKDVVFYLDVFNPKLIVCTGQQVTYTMKVKQSPGDDAKAGVKLEAGSSDKNVGRFRKDSVVSGEGDIDNLTMAEFVFIAGKKPGTTKIWFQGAVRGYDIHVGYVTSQMYTIKVVPCKYKVSTNSHWVSSSAYGSAFFFEFMNATLEAPVDNTPGGAGKDAEGTFTGTSGMLWIYYNRIPNFGSSTNIGGGTADLTGRIDEGGKLVLKIQFKSTPANETNCGQPGCASGGFSVEADPFSITLPGNGGTGSDSHIIRGAGQSAEGTTTVTVKPFDSGK